MDIRLSTFDAAAVSPAFLGKIARDV